MRLQQGDGVPFTQINNEILYSTTLSLKAKGLYAYMLSKPDNWNFTTRSMAAQLKEGRASIMKAMDELKEFGVLEHTKHSDGTGKYTIYAMVQKSDRGSKTAPCRNRTVRKLNRISNTDSTSNTDFISNPIWDYRKKLIATGYTGRLEKVIVELVEENVYLDSEGLLYTDTRSTKQLLQSTIQEIWEQLYAINEMRKPAKPERAMS